MESCTRPTIPSLKRRITHHSLTRKENQSLKDMLLRAKKKKVYKGFHAGIDVWPVTPCIFSYNRLESMWGAGVNGVNRLAIKGEKYYRLATKREKNYWLPTEKKLTDYRHGPPLSIFVFRKKRSEEHFVFFLAYEVTTLKVIIEFPVIFLLFGRKSAGSFCRTISGTRPRCLYPPNWRWQIKDSYTK